MADRRPGESLQDHRRRQQQARALASMEAGDITADPDLPPALFIAAPPNQLAPINFVGEYVDGPAPPPPPPPAPPPAPAPAPVGAPMPAGAGGGGLQPRSPVSPPNWRTRSQ